MPLRAGNTLHGCCTVTGEDREYYEYVFQLGETFIALREEKCRLSVFSMCRVLFFWLAEKVDVALHNSVVCVCLRVRQPKEQLLLSLGFFGDPWAEAAGHPSALPIVKSSQFRFLKHSVKMGRGWMFV